MSIIGEAVLTASVTASVELVLKKLASSELLSFASREQILADLKKWENKLRNIYAVLEDAEEKQITNRFMKDWLVELQNLAYDVEDLLDEFATEALERKLSHQPAEANTDFVVSYRRGPGLKSLKLLKHLQGQLSIFGLENINDVVDAKEADLSGKRNLRVLVLCWSWRVSNSDLSDKEMETLVLDLLRPNQKLEQLTIEGYGGISLPAWLGDTWFSNLVLMTNFQL
ncbi:hypothetical protein Dsin_030239 [Dipteronia sinensis]|uniref:Rx N-terminal domain-containing protein n=1 Tax=Dipteronia sinensis TaxID=43782 RepID=A0AAD9ZJN4_9ROSI|nr:hypothetical protein Dsin_030239 [Dipteronia sinensis]